MTDLYQNKYRIPSARLKNWDYSSNAAYFITICTKDRMPYFGEVVNGEMHLSEIGQLAHRFWAEIPQHFPFVQLDAFVIMPNHTHGIIIIDNPDHIPHNVETLQCNVSTGDDDDMNTDKKSANIQMQKISPKSGSISTIIRSFKSVTTKHAREIHADFEWQSRFHDHIIRDEKSFHTIRQYIIDNPLKWQDDKFYKL